MACIYKIQNKINGKVYIGQTIVSLESRLNREFHGHFADAFVYKKDHYLYRSMRKYGKDAFTYEVVEEVPIQCTKQETRKLLNEREVYWIKYYDSYCNGYNNTPGGTDLNKTLSEEHKRKISESHKGVKMSLEARQNMSKARKGLHLSEESRLKRLEKMKLKGTNIPSNKGIKGAVKHTPEMNKAKSERQKGRKFTEEHKQKLSEARKRAAERKRTEGTNNLTEEHRKRISEGLKRAYRSGRRLPQGCT